MIQFKQYFSWALVLAATVALIASAQAEECAAEPLALPSYYSFLGKYRMDRCRGVTGMGERFDKDYRNSDRHRDLYVVTDPAAPSTFHLTQIFTIDGKQGWGEAGPTIIPFINEGEKRTKLGKTEFYQKAKGDAEEVEASYIESDAWGATIKVRRSKLSFKKGNSSQIVFETSSTDPRVGKVWLKCEGRRIP